MQYPCNIFIRRSVKITHCDSVILKWKVPGGGGGVGGAKQPPFAMVTSSIAISPDQDLPLTPSNVTWTWKKIISLHTCTIGKKDLDTNSWMEPFRAFSLVLQKFDQISNNLSACCDHFWHMLPEPYNSSLGTQRFGAYSQEFMKKVEDRRFSNYDCNPKVRNCYQKRLTRPLEEIGTFASIHLFPWLPDLVKTFLLPLYTFRVPTDVPNMW